MEKKLKHINLKAFFFTKEGRGGMYACPHKENTFPANATFIDFNFQTLTVSYSVPNPDLDGGIIELTKTFSELDIENAKNFVAPTNINLLRKELWESFNNYAENQTDNNSRTTINIIAFNPNTSEIQKQRANEWIQWWENLWAVYAIKRNELINNEVMPTIDFDVEVGKTPWTIWEITNP